MKKYKIWVLLIGIICFHSSCEQPVDISLLHNPAIIIKGLVIDQPGSYYVELYRGSNQYFPGTPYAIPRFEPINDALVILTDNKGNVDTLKLWERDPEIRRSGQASAFYRTQHFPQAQAGVTYQLTVKHEGNTYTATATMPPPCPAIDRVTFDLQQLKLSPTYTYSCYVPAISFKEPQDQKNYYSFYYSFLDERDKGIYWVEDDLEGPENFWPLVGTRRHYTVVSDHLLKPQVNNLEILNKNAPPNFLGEFFHLHDHDTLNDIKIQMHSITQEAYEYFNVLGDLRQNNAKKLFSTAPASPPTNIQGGALGFFIVASVSKKTVPYPTK